MADDKRYLTDVGISGLPFPIKAISKISKEGQQTIADISIEARVMQQFEAKWIDKFMQVLHKHREYISTKTLKANSLDYLKAMNASVVNIEFTYPFFIEKFTPVSKEKCLVKYDCAYSVKVSSIEDEPKVIFKINAPVITTSPSSVAEKAGGLFGQLTVVGIEIEPVSDVFPEDLVEIADKYSLSPVYSFLTEDDQVEIIQKIHKSHKMSVVVADEIKSELVHKREIKWCSVKCSNFDMMHSYSTQVKTEKSVWIPFSGYEDNSGL